LRAAVVRRFGAERPAGRLALQVNQWPNPRCSVRKPLIVSWPARRLAAGAAADERPRGIVAKANRRLIRSGRRSR
jgi:hypothetical protein